MWSTYHGSDIGNPEMDRYGLCLLGAHLQETSEAKKEKNNKSQIIIRAWERSVSADRSEGPGQALRCCFTSTASIRHHNYLNS